jgi:para-nitrobenzyl esterase
MSKPRTIRRSRAIAIGVATAAVVLSLGVLAARRPAGSQSVSASCSPGTNVETTKGPVCGTRSNDVTTYRGIPYAAPPVGRLRWKSPRQHKPWKKTLQATTEANKCPTPGVPPSSAPGTGTSEDCLYLTIQRPANAKPGERLPVMYEIHGGGFLGQAGIDNGENLVRRGRVEYVYVGYRLGILGFLAHKALGKHSGNYGIQDQQAGLKWVQQNISRFGGDPHNVTIFGASAGGASVCDQVASPTAAGLFQKGISVSGFYNYQHDTIWPKADCKSTYYTEEHAQAVGARFAKKVGCTDDHIAVCLRKTPVDKLVRNGGQFIDPAAGGTVGPIIDGSTLTMAPKRAFATGHVNHVKLIADVGQDEFNGGVYENHPDRPMVIATTAAGYRKLVREQFHSWAPKVIRHYPLTRYRSPYVAYRTVMADSASVCPLLKTADALSAHIPVWIDLNADTGIPAASKRPLGALHGGTSRLVHYPSSELAPGQRALQNQLLAEWINFARAGRPNSRSAPSWTRYRPGHRTVLSLRSAAASRLVFAHAIGIQHHCTFWNKVTHY